MGEFDIAKRMRNTKIVLPNAPQARQPMNQICWLSTLFHSSFEASPQSLLPFQGRMLCAEKHHPEHGHEDAWLV